MTMQLLDVDVIDALRASDTRDNEAMRRCELLTRKYQEAMVEISSDHIWVEPSDDYDSGIRALRRALTGQTEEKERHDSRHQND